MLDLLRDADVVVENFRTGVMERLGLSYETIQAHNAKIVYAAIRGFGDPRTGESPYSDWPAFDVVAQAMGGVIGITGTDAAHPLKVGPGVGDLFPATLATVGLLAAVVKARETGLGQFVDVAMYDGVISLCERIVFQYDYTGSAPTPGGNGHPLLSPFGVFPAKDGWVTIAAPREHQWQELCSLMGRADLAHDDRFDSNAKRVQHDALVRKIIDEWSARRTKQEIAETLGGRVPYGPVNTAAEIFADPHVKARGMLLQLEQPGSDTPVQVAGMPIKFTGTPRVESVRAPLTGEHTEAVLAEIGATTAHIAELRSAGAIG
jgi:crotonobetainyl-CoA:carnitine CoA-transferase CaiB-like acyl-CoA transferase